MSPKMAVAYLVSIRRMAILYPLSCRACGYGQVYVVKEVESKRGAGHDIRLYLVYHCDLQMA